MTARKIAGYRVMLGKTQKDMAKALGITPQAYSAKENGKRSFKDSEKIIIKNMVSVLFPSITYEELFF
jgi:putative transcriptional regulator